MKKEYERFADSTLFEGMVSVRALIDAAENQLHDRRILSLFYDKEKAEKNPKELAWLGHRAQEQQFTITQVDRSKLDEMAIGSSHGGVLAIASERHIAPLTSEVIEKDGFYAYLDGVEDPYNFGYAIRSLYALGCNGIILPERNWMGAAGVVCRSSAGASERIAMWQADCEQAARLFHSSGYRVVAGDLRNAVPCEQADLTLPIFLLVGGEKRGISRHALECVDLSVRIDYSRQFDASLSAASAVTVLAYEVFRQNHLGNDSNVHA